MSNKIHIFYNTGGFNPRVVKFHITKALEKHLYLPEDFHLEEVKKRAIPLQPPSMSRLDGMEYSCRMNNLAELGSHPHKPYQALSIVREGGFSLHKSSPTMRAMCIMMSQVFWGGKDEAPNYQHYPGVAIFDYPNEGSRVIDAECATLEFLINNVVGSWLEKSSVRLGLPMAA